MAKKSMMKMNGNKGGKSLYAQGYETMTRAPRSPVPELLVAAVVCAVT